MFNFDLSIIYKPQIVFTRITAKRKNLGGSTQHVDILWYIYIFILYIYSSTVRVYLIY